MSDLERELLVVAIEGDTIDVTEMSGPPTLLLTGWVHIRATNDEVTVVRRMSQSEYRTARPMVGDRMTVTLTPEEAE